MKKHRHLQTKIYDLLKKGKSKLQHIHSHQDKLKDTLTFEEKLNQFCDKKCENFYKEWSPDMLPKPVPIKIPDIPHLAIKNIPIYEYFYKALSIQKYEPRIREKFKKFGNLLSTFDKIDWKSLESSLEKINNRRKYVKTIWQLWYTRKRAFREKNR